MMTRGLKGRGDRPFVSGLIAILIFALWSTDSLATSGISSRKNKETLDCLHGEAAALCTTRPKTKKNKPVKISVALRLLDIIEVDEKGGSWTVRAFLYAHWKDSRLRFKPANYDGARRVNFFGESALAQLKRIWHPQLTIVNHISERVAENLEIFINRNGKIEYKEMFNVKIRTNFDFRKFPFDEQIATIELESFGSSQQFVRLVPAVRKGGNSSTPPSMWKAGDFSIVFGARPEPRYELSSDSPGAWLAPDGVNDFSLMVATLVLKRQHRNFITTKILPLFMFAMVIWLNAFGWTSDKGSLPWPYAGLLGVIFFSHGAQNMLPTLPYPTLFKLWIVQVYVYIVLDFLLWVFAARPVALANEAIQKRIKRLQVYGLGPLLVVTWAITGIWFLEPWPEITTMLTGG